MLNASAFSISHDADGVVVFTLDRPAVKNALTRAIYQQLRDGFRAAAHDDDVAAIVLTGAGGAFSSGGDVNEVVGDLITRTAGEQAAWNRLTAETVAAMRALGKPIIAAVDGVAAGGGAALALAADLRVGTDRARFGFLFARLGLCAADMGVSWLLPRLVGAGRAAELLYFGDFIDARTARDYGLLNLIVAKDDLMPFATGWARRLAAGSAKAFAESKRTLDAVATLDFTAALAVEVEAQTRCMQHRDFREGYQAFVDKRPPRFRR